MKSHRVTQVFLFWLGAGWGMARAGWEVTWVNLGDYDSMSGSLSGRNRMVGLGVLQGLTAAEAYPHPCAEVRCIETHISWVFLTGEYAYKVKKPVNFGFLDFSTLARRLHFCEEELRCNRRFAAALYLNVVSITQTADGGLLVGAAEQAGPGNTVLDYAVRMRQFPSSAELDVRLNAGLLGVPELARFGAALAALHNELPRAAHDAAWGTAAAAAAPVAENFAQIRNTAYQAEHSDRLARLEAWGEAKHRQLVETFAERRRAGFIRECHGDLHLSNLVLIEDEVTAFDCIEFSPALRWIDTQSDVAFLVMDCLVRGRRDLAYGFLDAYLAAGGDYAGVRLFGYFLVYRSMVRAKVAALQSDAPDSRERFLGHLEFAERRAFDGRPMIVLTCGLSGSGKSWLAERLVTTLGALRIRSDVERKRLVGLAAEERSGSAMDAGLYDAATTDAVYARLAEAARDVIGGGETAIVDATFLDAARRVHFQELAAALEVPVVILYCTAPDAVLEQRVASRKRAGTDASEADIAVLAHQRQTFDPPRDEGMILVDTEANVDAEEIAARIRQYTGMR